MTDTRTTTNPCPSWCEERAGHGYYSLTVQDGSPCRDHFLNVAYLVSARQNYDVAVDITAMEVAESDDDEHPLVGFR